MKIKLRNSLDVLDPLQVALLANAPSLEKLSSKKQSIRHIKIFIVCELSHLQLFVTPWTVAPQAPLSTGFSRQEHCSGLLCPPPGDLPTQGSGLSGVSCVGRILYQLCHSVSILCVHSQCTCCCCC